LGAASPVFHFTGSGRPAGRGEPPLEGDYPGKFWTRYCRIQLSRSKETFFSTITMHWNKIFYLPRYVLYICSRDIFFSEIYTLQHLNCSHLSFVQAFKKAQMSSRTLNLSCQEDKINLSDPLVVPGKNHLRKHVT
jgi:hypothetical protein